MNQDIGATEGGRDWGAIIPSFLDDYGLDPYEMRVYIRLARRAGMGGQCWESISKMASSCRMSDRLLKRLPGTTNRSESDQTDQALWIYRCVRTFTRKSLGATTTVRLT